MESCLIKSTTSGEPPVGLTTQQVSKLGHSHSAVIIYLILLSFIVTLCMSSPSMSLTWLVEFLYSMFLDKTSSQLQPVASSHWYIPPSAERNQIYTHHQIIIMILWDRFLSGVWKDIAKKVGKKWERYKQAHKISESQLLQF